MKRRLEVSDVSELTRPANPVGVARRTPGPASPSTRREGSPLDAGLRRSVLLGVPVLYLALGLLHPMENPVLGDPTTLFIGLHIAQLVLIGGLAAWLWLLVDGLSGGAAMAARVLILPFVIVYTALDSVLGIAWGLVTETANEVAAADRASAGRLVEALLEPTPLGYALYFGAGLAWLAASLTALIAIRGRTPWPLLLLMTIGCLSFALGHAQPTGPIGMALLLVGIGWSELTSSPGGAASDPNPA